MALYKFRIIIVILLFRLHNASASTSSLLWAQIPLGDTTQHAIWPMHFGTEKVVTCCVALVEQHGTTRASWQARQVRLARHVFRGVATAAWTGADMSTSLFPEVVPEIDANPERKRLNSHTLALLLLRRSPITTRHARHIIVTCREVAQQVEFGLYNTSVRRPCAWAQKVAHYPAPTWRT